MSREVYDPIRCGYFEATPEELVRQRLIALMVEELGYSKSLLSVEKGLDGMPHLPPGNYPTRRFDLVAFCKGVVDGHPLYPLMVVECKSVPLKREFREQVIGYNHILRAPFVALVNNEEIEFAAAGDYTFRSGLPTYEELIRCLQSKS